MTIPMPEPVAWGIYNPTLRLYELSKEKVETKYRDDGTVVYVVVPFITTTQAEAYKDACVREALESLQWISVADRLPDERERVLAFGRIRSTNLGPGKLGISVAWRIADRYFTDGASNVFGGMLCVTHWMPLPASPLPGPVEPTT